MFGPTKKQLWRQLREERAQHRVEIQNLLDRLAAARDKPWTLPPRPIERPALTEDERELRDYEAATQEL